MPSQGWRWARPKWNAKNPIIGIAVCYARRKHHIVAPPSAAKNVRRFIPRVAIRDAAGM
jgi:hypothetical protein